MTSLRDFIVCGWYTPDYRVWWTRLRENLDNIGVPYDFVERAKTISGWEINTMRKPHEVLSAMGRHPDKIIVFLDVDCRVPGGRQGLQELAAIRGDVAFFAITKWSRRSFRPIYRARSGTMVFRPTKKARAFVEAWCKVGETAPRYAWDQDSMVVATGRVPGLSITYLDNKFCATPEDECPDPVILHDRASTNAHTNKWIKKLDYMKRLLVGKCTSSR